MKRVSGYIVKFGNLYYFKPDGWKIMFFWSRLHGQWLRTSVEKIDDYWHRHVRGSVEISKLMIK